MLVKAHFRTFGQVVAVEGACDVDFSKVADEVSVVYFLYDFYFGRVRFVYSEGLDFLLFLYGFVRV